MKLLSRREVLAGLFAVPALGTLLRSARAAAQGMVAPRFCFLYFGNGAHPQWTPPANGELFGALPQFMQPLDAVRSDLLIIKNLTLLLTESIGHNLGSLGVLTGVDARFTQNMGGVGQGTIVNANSPSLDQVLAARIAASGAPTPVPVLNVGNLALPGATAAGPRIAFSATTPVVPVPAERDPLAAFQRVVAQFVPAGGMDPGGQALARLYAQRKSVLDAVRGDVARLNARVSNADRAQLDAYLTALRGVETGFGPPPGSSPPVPPSGACSSAPAPPAAGPLTLSNLGQHKLILQRHLDVVAFALSCGLTRVATVQLSDGSLNYDGTWMGLTTDCHAVSHYAGMPNPALAIAHVAKHQEYWMSQLVYLVQKLKGMPEASGSVLDGSLVAMTTQNGDCNSHYGVNTPFILAGSAGGRVRTGGRLLDAGGRVHNDLLVAIAHAMGFGDITTFGKASFNRGPLPLT